MIVFVIDNFIKYYFSMPYKNKISIFKANKDTAFRKGSISFRCKKNVVRKRIGKDG